MIPKQLKILVAALLTVSLGAVVSVKANPTIEPIQSRNSIRHRLVGHTDKVLRISFSSDGKTIASGSFDETVKLWSIDGRLLKTLTGHKDDL
jgi:WD40 repeat protein